MPFNSFSFDLTPELTYILIAICGVTGFFYALLLVLICSKNTIVDT